jgi:hypothetical protein
LGGRGVDSPRVAASAFSCIRRLAWSSIDVRMGVGASRRVVVGVDSASVAAAAVGAVAAVPAAAVSPADVAVADEPATTPAPADLRFSFSER